MAKRFNGTLKILILWALGIVFAAGGVYTVVCYRLGHTEVDVVKIEEKSKETVTRVRKVEDAVIQIQSDIGYIQRDVGKILKKIEADG